MYKAALFVCPESDTFLKNYVCTDDSGRSLPVSSGNNGMLRVSFPEGFDGNILLTFQEPPHWRIAEGISLTVGLGCVLALLRFYIVKKT